MANKTPTIKHFLNSMPEKGINNAKDSLMTYASLSFYFDGEDMKSAKVNKIKAKQALIDSLNPAEEYSIEEVDKGDAYVLKIGESSYKFNVPSLDTMPDINESTLRTSLRLSIESLAEFPDQVFSLPYQYFPAVLEVVGKCLGT